MRALQPMMLAAVMAWPVLGLAQGGGASGRAPRVPLDNLRDVAVAVYDDVAPVIYYNPTLMQRVGPLLSAFFFAHEDGHIAFRHTRSYALLAGVRGQTALLQARELEADCYAARQLATENPAAVRAAIRFFGQMGPFRLDQAHPTGAQRAARVLSCLPEAADASGEGEISVHDGDSFVVDREPGGEPALRPTR